MSFSLDSCVPAPVCQDKTYKMDSLDRYRDISHYLGDSSQVDWVGQGEPAIFNGNTLLTMPPKSVGTVLATTTYMWYGTVKAKIKTSRGAGVVTAFILFSDVKDEIDFEWVGTDLSNVQTNYYFQGIPSYVNSGNSSVSSNTFDNFHEYEIKWTPEEIQWLVDGVVTRTKKKSDTWNATANQWDFPQTPSRVQISLWPGGLETNAKGTIDWAGGPIDWAGGDIKDYGYYFATFGEIKVECYNAPSAPGTNKKKSYYFNNIRATNDTVVDSDKRTTLKSLAATGLEMDIDDGTGADTSSVASVPGGSNPPGQVPGGSNSGSGNSGSGSSTGSSAGCQTTGFAQTCGSAAGGNSGGIRVTERTLSASALAVIVGIAGLLLI
jgi:beta-glucanase (GH16 family)